MVLLEDGNYGDLIKFYNRVFAPTIGPFARQFSSSSDFHTIHMTNLPLSPLPVSIPKLKPEVTLYSSKCVKMNFPHVDYHQSIQYLYLHIKVLNIQAQSHRKDLLPRNWSSSPRRKRCPMNSKLKKSKM